MDTTEVRTTNEKTGGQKGSKLQRFASMPTKTLLELAEHYGKGVTKYPDTGVGPNYSRGYDWHLSYEAAMRHLTQFWAGEDLDPETGSKHVIAAAWHCLALSLFMDTHPELDDRWEKPKPPETYMGLSYEEASKRVMDQLQPPQIHAPRLRSRED